jgi:hypothetical protein
LGGVAVGGGKVAVGDGVGVEVGVEAIVEVGEGGAGVEVWVG